MAVKSATANALHHGQVLQIVMCLEQRISCEELDKDASNTPDITGEGPPESENNLRRPIMASRYDGRVILVLEGSRAKVDQPDLGIK